VCERVQCGSGSIDVYIYAYINTNLILEVRELEGGMEVLVVLARDAPLLCVYADAYVYMDGWAE
jgi:hypothetical protein